MNKDSLIYLSVPKDTLLTQIQQINNQFKPVDKTIGSGLVGLWLIGLVFVLFIFKRH
jgi:hypothetical protein